MSDFLDEKLAEIRERMEELKPLIEEYRKLEAAERALAGVSSSPAPSAPRAPRPASSGSGSGGGGGGTGNGPGRPGKRKQEALELVKERPGITIPEMAEAMEIQQNYLYRVLPGLAEEGLVIKSGRGWHLREQGGADAS